MSEATQENERPQNYPFFDPLPSVLERHYKEHILGSGIDPEVAKERGYKSILGETELKGLEFTKAQRRVSGLLIPVYSPDGKIAFHQYRPDNPRLDSKNKPIKYETPYGIGMRLDVHPRCREKIKNPSIPLFVTEGIKKVDSLVSRGECAIGLLGVWNFKGKNEFGGTTFLADWDYITLKERLVYIVYDSDIMTKPEVKQALDRITEHLKRKGAIVSHIYLPSPDGEKVGVDDYLAQGHTIGDLLALAREPESGPRFQTDNKKERKRKKDDTLWGGNFRGTLQNFLSSLSESRQKVLFSDVLNCAKNFLYITPDTEFAFKMALSSVIGNYFEDDPLWMLIVAPPSSAKTEIILSLGGSPFAWNVSSLTSKTLASGDRNNPEASLLKRIEAFGLIFLKDLTTILEQNSIDRGEIFSQLREVYDGSYFKTFGNGVVVNWKGKIGIVGACTPIIEKYGEAFKVLGERFLMCRISDVTTDNEELALDKALQDQSNSINYLRESLKAMVSQFLQGCLSIVLIQEITFTQEHLEIIKTCAKFIAKTRAAVVRDTYSRDDILVKPFQEAPMRVAKQLKNLLRGLCVVDSVTSPNDIHFSYLFKVALDNIPSLRKEILEAVPGEGIFRADLFRKLGYNEKSGYVRRLMEDLTKLQILREEKKGNRIFIFPSNAVSDFYALFDKFRTENIEEFEKCPEKYPPSNGNSLNEETEEFLRETEDI